MPASTIELSDIIKRFPNLKVVDFPEKRSKKSTWACSCGAIFHRTLPQVWNSPRGCPDCGRANTKKAIQERQRAVGHRRALELFDLITHKHQQLKILESIKDLSVNSKTPLMVWCKTCRIEFKASLSFMWNRKKYGCPSCGVRESQLLSRKSRNLLQESRSRELHKDVLSYIKKFPNLRIKGRPSNRLYSLKCVKCKETWTAARSTIFNYVSSGCKTCSIEAVSSKQLDLNYEKKALRRYKSLIILDTPVNKRTEIRFKCLICATQFLSYLSDPFCKCPSCYPRTIVPSGNKRGGIFKTTKIGHQKVSGLQGYEPNVLHFMVKDLGFDQNLIHKNPVGKRHLICIDYTFLGKSRKHYPDFVLGKDPTTAKTLVEVKSVFTAGLTELCRLHRKNLYRESKGYDILKAKARSAINQGYTYRVVIHVKRQDLVLPIDFYKMSKGELLLFLHNKYMIGRG